MLSIIIPSYKDPLLQKTIDSLLENAEGEIEIIAVLDGYWPEPFLKDDKRVKVIHFGENQGMRNAINSGVSISKGEYLMKCDSHCIFGKGYDRIILETIEDNWVVIPRRYFLDTEKWEVMDLPPVDYEKFCIDRKLNKFTGINWKNRAEERKDIMIDENMTMQGSCWIMSRKHWENAIGELSSEGYGTFAQEPIEITMKTFVAGGKIMSNKNTWYAHKHRSFDRTYTFSRKEIASGNDYSLNLWKDEYEKMRKKWKQ